MVGSELCREFSTLHELITPDKIYLDVRNINQVMSFKETRPDIIIHLAAATDHIACEFNPQDAYMTNTIGTMNMLTLAKKTNARFIYLSTCGIFDGSMPRYTESDIPNPINHYSRSKYFGEILCRSYSNHAIIRSGWMMGGGPKNDKKFCNKIFHQIIGGAKQIYAINDIFGSPTWSNDLAVEIKEISLNDKLSGIFHCANFGEVSRYEVAKEFVYALGLSSRIEVIGLSFEDYHKKFKLNCPYTKTEVCMSQKLPPMRYWKDALYEYTRKEFLPCLQATS